MKIYKVGDKYEAVQHIGNSMYSSLGNTPEEARINVLKSIYLND